MKKKKCLYICRGCKNIENFAFNKTQKKVTQKKEDRVF